MCKGVVNSIRSHGSWGVLGMAAVLAFGAAAEATPVFFPTDDLPPPTGSYVAPTSDIWQTYVGSGATALLRNPLHTGFLAWSTPPGASQTKTYTFPSTVSGEVSINNGLTWIPMTGSATATIKVTWDHQTGSTRYFDTELLQLDVSGGTMLPGMMIRESPTLASLGTASIEQVAGGYMIESFFDVFTELTINAGAFWHPSTHSGPLVLIPEPATIALLGLGLAGMRRRPRVD